MPPFHRCSVYQSEMLRVVSSGAVIVLTARVAKVHSVGVNHRAGTMSGMIVRDGGRNIGPVY